MAKRKSGRPAKGCDKGKRRRMVGGVLKTVGHAAPGQQCTQCGTQVGGSSTSAPKLDPQCLTLHMGSPICPQWHMRSQSTDAYISETCAVPDHVVGCCGRESETIPRVRCR